MTWKGVQSSSFLYDQDVWVAVFCALRITNNLDFKSASSVSHHQGEYLGESARQISWLIDAQELCIR
jgi:hypothetical protein